MKQAYSRFMQNTLKHIHQTYGFLFEKGYELFSAEEIPTGSQVLLKKRHLFVKIVQLRGEEEFFFRSGPQPSDEFTDIGTVIYAATGEMIPRWKSSNVKVLEHYLDRIESYFEEENAKNEAGLRIAEKEYAVRNDELLRAEQSAYYAASSQGEVVSPPEPKVIPVLHYPLMGIILLLLFGALTTLYMAMLYRLFSAFSLDPNDYSFFAGVGALLLSIGTMLLFRRRRKKA